MKIGIFGDSFAAPSGSYRPPWWSMLKAIGEHTVTTHGATGSSIIYSADQICIHGEKYDFLIWCLTDLDRMTTNIGDKKFLHFSHGNYSIDFDPDDAHHQLLLDISKQYQKYFEYHHYRHLTDDALISYVQRKFQNLMIIPAFPYIPLGIGKEFNLSTVSLNELKAWGVDQEPDLFQRYKELRATHLCHNNNAILAELVNNNLQPGIFTADYADFKPPDGDFKDYFL